MQIKEVINSLNLQLLTHTGDMQAEVTGGYASDLLSNVMGQAEQCRGIRTWLQWHL